MADPVVLRASWGQGFKAPNLTELYVSRSQSFNDVQDIYRCEAIGIAEDDCPSNQVENFRSGNPELQAESSRSFNVGAVFEPTDDLQVSLDAFRIELEDGVDVLGFDTIIELENRGSLPEGIEIQRGASTQPGDPGALVWIVRPFTNQSLTTVEGFDIRANYQHSLAGGGGVLAADLEATLLTKFEEIPSEADDPIDYVAEERAGAPAERIVGSLRWSRDVWTTNLIWRYIGDHDEGDYEDLSTWDVTVVWDTPWGGDISAGVRNLTDEDPVIDSVSGWDDGIVLELYDVAGRVPFITYRHEF